MAKQSAENAERIRRERDEALREVQHLKKLLKKKEEDCQTAEEELMKARRVRRLYGIMTLFSRAALKLSKFFEIS